MQPNSNEPGKEGRLVCNTRWMLKKPKDARGGLARVVMNCRLVGNGPRLSSFVHSLGLICTVEIDYLASNNIISRRVIDSSAQWSRKAPRREQAGVIDDGGVMVGRSRGP